MDDCLKIGESVRVYGRSSPELGYIVVKLPEAFIVKLYSGDTIFVDPTMVFRATAAELKSVR